MLFVSGTALKTLGANFPPTSRWGFIMVYWEVGL